MKCNYTASLPFEATDTLDAIYAGAYSVVVGATFDNVSAIQIKLDALVALIVGGGGSVDSAVYSFDGGVPLITIVQSTSPFNYLEWTTGAGADGGNLYTESLCTLCDYSLSFDFDLGAFAYGFCIDSSCVAALAIDVTDNSAMLAALHSYYASATGVTYSFNVGLQRGVINITGWSSSDKPLKVQLWDGSNVGTIQDSNNFLEGECRSQIFAGCGGFDCDKKDLSIDEIARLLLYQSANCDEKPIVNFKEDSISDDTLSCDDEKDFDTIFRKLIMDDGCLSVRAQVRGDADSLYYDCDNLDESILQSFLKCIYKTANGCYILRCLPVGVDDVCAIINCDEQESFEDTIRKCFVVDDSGIVSLAIVVDNNAHCGDLDAFMICDNKDLSLEAILKLNVAPNVLSGYSIVINLESA